MISIVDTFLLFVVQINIIQSSGCNWKDFPLGNWAPDIGTLV